MDNAITLEVNTASKSSPKDQKEHLHLTRLINSILKILGYHDGLVLDKYSTNNSKQAFWKGFILLWPILCIINLTDQFGLLGLKYSIFFIIPFQIMTTYLHFIFYPKWVRSTRLKTILKQQNIVKRFDKHLCHTVIFLIALLPLLIYILISLPEGFTYSNSTVIHGAKQLTVIFAVPYTIIFTLLIHLALGTISVTFDVVCERIKTYLETIRNTIEDHKDSKESIIPLIYEEQLQIEELSLDINDLVGSPIGIIMIMGLLIVFTHIYSIFSDINNGDDIILYVSIPSIIMYGGGVDYLLYCCTRWNTAFELNTYKWKNRADLIPGIVRDFGDLGSFHTWLDNHECHNVRLFGKRGIKINYDVYIKVLSLVGTVGGYLVGVIMDKIK